MNNGDERSPNTGARGLLATVLVTVAACHAGVELEVSQEPLNGSSLLPSSEHPCRSDRWAKVQQAWSLVTNQVVNLEGRALVQCMKDSYDQQGTIDGPGANAYNFPYFSGYPELVMWRLRENVSTTFHCHGEHGNYVGPGEQIGLSDGTIDTQTPSVMASLMLHELAHAKLFQHVDGFLDSGQSPPIILQNCMLNVLAGRSQSSYERQNGQWETTLSLVGLEGKVWASGVGAHRDCGTQRLAAGFSGTLSSSGYDITSLGLTCKPKNIDYQDSKSAIIGVASGSSFDLRCNTGEVLVGAYGWASEKFHTLGAVCQPEANVEQRTSTGRRRRAGTVAAGGQFEWERTCPDGFAVKGIGGKWSSFLNTLELRCQDWATPLAVNDTYQGAFGGFPGQTYDERPLGRSLLTGIKVKSNGSVLRRVGGTTARIVVSGTTYSPEAVFALPSHGIAMERPDEPNYEDACPARKAIIGVRVSYGYGGITAIGDIKCVDINAWANGTPTTIEQHERMLGTPGEYSGTTTCPNKYFVDGWKIDASDQVNGLQIHCRRF